jgi:alkaline phosphatase D
LIWICASEAAKLRVEYSPGADFSKSQTSAVVGLTQENDFTAQVVLDRLQAATRYVYRVVDASAGNAVSEPCYFSTAATGATPFSFVFTGDAEDTYRPFRLFDVMAAQKADFFLHLGDTVYADHPRREFSPSIRHYRRKHVAIRRDSHLQAFLAATTTYAIWDDHETENNCHGGNPAMADAMQVFKEYWPCRTESPDGLYRHFQWSSLCDFFILDTRRFRSPQSQADDAGKTMLGAAQKTWFKDRLKASKAPFKFVATSVPFHGGGSDTWGNYRSERNEIRSHIRDEKIGGVVFLTADYHLARDWSDPKTGLREYMAGPIASFTHYSRTPASRERYEKAGTFHYGDGYNFGLVKVSPEGQSAKAELSFVDANGKALFNTTFGA